MWVPLQIKKKQKRFKSKEADDRDGEGEKLGVREFFFFLLSLLSSIYENRTVGFRRGKNENALLDEGYAWELKTRDFAEFSIKKF